MIDEVTDISVEHPEHQYLKDILKDYEIVIHKDE